MSGEDRRIRFCSQAWNIVTKLQTVSVQDNVEYYQQELNKLYKILTITEKDNISFEDLSEFIIGSERVKDMQYDTLMNYLNEHIFIEPYSYDFYFRVGSLYNFTTCYEIRRGSVYQFKDLPIEIRQVYLRPLMHSSRNIEEIEKRHENKRFLHFKVKSIGSYKALEKAIQELKRSISILKLIYMRQTSYFVDPTFASYHVIDSKHKIVITYQDTVIERNPIVKIPRLDNIICHLTNITKKDNRTELEHRIVNAIDIFGMIEENTPLQIRFLLCIISLEGLLLAKEDKDYLGSRIADKMAFLLGDSPEWLTANHNLLAESRGKMAHLSERYMGKGLR